MAIEFLDTLDDATTDERVESFRGGMDAYSRAATLPPATHQLLQNCMVYDNDLCGTRPGADAIGGAVLSAADPIQALIYYDTPSIELLLAAVDGTLRKWDNSAWSTVGSYPFGTDTIVEMAQGNNLVYCSTTSGQWQATNGTTWTALGAVNAGVAGDPPVGASIMAWHTFRMFATGSFGGFNDQIYVSQLGDAGSGKWDYAKFAFRVGRGEGQAITALCSAVGDWLAVGKENSVYMVNTDPQATSAASWVIRRLAGAVGCVGKRAMVSFGDFLLVFGADGLRRIAATADREDMPWEVSPPLSEPVQPYINRINEAYRSTIVLHKYRHLCLVAVPLDSATSPSHVLVWNSRTGAWMGVWTGWTPTVFCTTSFGTVGNRLAIGDSAGYVNQWKDDAADADDSATYADNSVAIETAIRLRSFLFGMPINMKDGAFVEVRFVNTPGNVSVQVIYDGAGADTWLQNMGQVQNQLPLSLPFDLASVQPYRFIRSLDHLGEFNEAEILISATSGRVQVKNASMAAYLNTVPTE